MVAFPHHSNLLSGLSFLLCQAIFIPPFCAESMLQQLQNLSVEKKTEAMNKTEKKSSATTTKKTINLLMNHISETRSELAQILNQRNYFVWIAGCLAGPFLSALRSFYNLAEKSTIGSQHESKIPIHLIILIFVRILSFRFRWVSTSSNIIIMNYFD